jgi:hypothetical protein
MGLIRAAIIAVLGMFGAIIIAVTGRLFSDEIKEWLPWITRYLTERAVSRLPESEREKRREEWESDLNEWPGNLAKLYRAWGYLSASRSIAKIARPGETPPIADRLWAVATAWLPEYVRPMTPDNPRWDEFIDCLAGPEGCDFRETDAGPLIWTCDPSDRTRPHCRSIMQHMGLSRMAIGASLAYFEQRGGYCDCEVLFNVDLS